jgi:hypothetical protein
MKSLCLLLLLSFAFQGCSAGFLLNRPDSQASSAASSSGSGSGINQNGAIVSTADHYTVTHGVGLSLRHLAQESQNGHYQTQ